MWLDIRIGVRNIIRWTPVIWHDADCDHAYLSRILEYKFMWMSKSIANGYTVGRRRHAKQLLICAFLCKRLDHDDYCFIAEKRFPQRDKNWANMINALVKQDREMLGRMIAKHYTEWWD